MFAGWGSLTLPRQPWHFMCAERARSLVSESGSTIEKDGSGDEWWTFHLDFFLDCANGQHGCGRVNMPNIKKGDTPGKQMRDTCHMISVKIMTKKSASSSTISGKKS